MTRRRFLAVLAAAASAGACGSTTPSPVARRTQAPAASGGGAIVVAGESEPQSLLGSIGGGRADASQHVFEMVHQSLVTYDDQARPIARVASALPSLQAGTWTVHDDGTMETVWQLRDDVRWHDGEPFTADDVAFSWTVFSDASIPVASRRVARLIDRIETPDPSTAVIHWRSRYAFADQLSGYDLPLLPRHILEAPFALRREQLAAHPYWRSQFVGLGPFRVDQWLGNAVRLVAFSDYFLGAPGLDEITLRFVADSNAAMTGILGGAVDVLLPRRALPGAVQAIEQRWPSGEGGALSLLPGYSWVFIAPQFAGPQPEDLLDVRVREALLCALDRPAIAEATIGDRSLAADLWIWPDDPRRAAIDGEVARHDYDPARARDLFRQAGWRRESADDVLVKQGHRFELEITTTQEWERISAAVEEYWRDVGVAVHTTVLTRAAVSNRQGRASYSGVELMGGAPSLVLVDGRLSTANAPGPENQFVGANRGHYASAELDQLLDRYWTIIDPQQRDEAEGAIARRITAELPIMGLFFYPAMAAVRATVDGVRMPRGAGPSGQWSASWNAHQWRTV